MTTTGTNLTAAESRIRDADMSQEMLNFTKLQILSQSGTAMLAQANQLPADGAEPYPRVSLTAKRSETARGPLRPLAFFRKRGGEV